jgi:hypothetical protein
MAKEKVAACVRTDNRHILPPPPWSLKWPPVCGSDKASDLDLTLTHLDGSTPANVVYRLIEFFVASGHIANK